MQNGKFLNLCCSRYYLRSSEHDLQAGQNERLLMESSINSRMVATGKTCPSYFPPYSTVRMARAFNGEQQEWLSNWWILYMDKCVNRLKKSQVDNADHHWLPSCQKYLQCRCWLERVLFLQIDEWNQKASSCWYVGISLLYPLHKSQYLRWCGIDWDVDTQHRLLQVETR